MISTVMPAIIAAKMRRYKGVFHAAGATTPATAIRLADAGLREGLIFRKLVQQRVLIATGDGRFYLDEIRDREVLRNRRKIITVLFLVILALFIIGAVVVAWVK